MIYLDRNIIDAQLHTATFLHFKIYPILIPNNLNTLFPHLSNRQDREEKLSAQRNNFLPANVVWRDRRVPK